MHFGANLSFTVAAPLPSSIYPRIKEITPPNPALMAVVRIKALFTRCRNCVDRILFI